jgi:hypothetical protein
LVAASPPPERLSLAPVPDDRPPEPLAVVTDAEAEMPLPSDPQTFFLGGIFALSVFATLYLASPIILPVVLAFVLKTPSATGCASPAACASAPRCLSIGAQIWV